MFSFLLPNLSIIYIFVWKPRKAEWWLHPVVTQNQESFVVLAGAFFYNLILIQVKTSFLAGTWGLNCLLPKQEVRALRSWRRLAVCGWAWVSTCRSMCDLPLPPTDTQPSLSSVYCHRLSIHFFFISIPLGWTNFIIILMLFSLFGEWKPGSLSPFFSQSDLLSDGCAFWVKTPEEGCFSTVFLREIQLQECMLTYVNITFGIDTVAIW